MVERIAAAHGSIAGTVCLPRPKQSARDNISHRLWINQPGVEAQRLIRSNSRHRQTLDVELQRELSRSEGVDDQNRPVTHKPVDNDLDLPRRPYGFHLSPLLPGR